MDVVANVFLTKAVVARAAGTVAELQVGPLCVGPAADVALVAVAPLLLLLFLLPHGGFKLDGLVGGLVPGPPPAVGDLIGDPGPEEYNEVENGDDGQQRQQKAAGEKIAEKRQGKIGGVQPGQPLHLDREEEENQKLGVRIEHGKGEEHGEVDVVRAGNAGGAKDQTDHNTSQNS